MLVLNCPEPVISLHTPLVVAVSMVFRSITDTVPLHTDIESSAPASKSIGSEIIKESVISHPLISVIVTLYDPDAMAVKS